MKDTGETRGAEHAQRPGRLAGKGMKGSSRSADPGLLHTSRDDPSGSSRFGRSLCVSARVGLGCVALRKDGRADRMGRMNVYVATRNPVKLRAVRDAFTAWFRETRVDVRAVDPAPRLPEQPLGEEVGRGAIARAKAAIESSDAEWGVGIEAGLIQLPGSERWLSVQVCAIVDREGRIALGLGTGY